MGWTGWVRKSGPDPGVVVGLDLTSARARAVVGPTTDLPPRLVPLDDDLPDLPLAISLEERTALVGREGASLVRRLPHAVCRAYLPALGQQREWRSGRHRLNPAGAVALLVQRLQLALAGHNTFAVAVPAYLSAPQAKLLGSAIEQAKFTVVGTATAPLALAAGAGDQFATALVVEADDHALTWTVLSAGSEQVRVLATQVQPAVATRNWLEQMLNAVSNRCVKICRRDPRDSGAAEQSVYEQLDAACDTLRPGQPVGLIIRAGQWYQELTIAGDDMEQVCALLARQAVEGMRQALAEAHSVVPAMAAPDLLWLTPDAARLPGLVAALTENLPESTAVRPLPADAVAKAVHALAARWLGGEQSRGHLETTVTLNGRVRPVVPAKSHVARPK
jgi:hypothetical protein